MFLFFFKVFAFPPSDPQDENKIGIDGIQQFCDDLNLDPASISVLVVAWKFRAATQCEFSKKEFIDGMTELGWAMTSFLYLVMRTVDHIWFAWWLGISLKVLWEYHTKCPTTWQNHWEITPLSVTVLSSENHRKMSQSEMLDVSQIISHVLDLLREAV